MNKFFVKGYDDTRFITGMRAFAALMVVLIHTSGGGFGQVGTIANNIVDLGRTGVYVFFVISGFSVAVSYASSGGYWNYINKRIWRIAPLYYFWLITAVLLGAASTDWQKEFGLPGITLYNWLLHIFFLGFFDYRITNSIIGAEWSISVEVFWYFFVPALIYFGRSNWRLVFLVCFSFVIYKISQSYPGLLPVSPGKAALAMHWSPIPYLFSFVLGVAAYKIRSKVIVSTWLADAVLAASILFVIFHINAPDFVNRFFSGEIVFVSVLAALVITFGTDKSLIFKAIFCNGVSQLLGVVSYGIYLSHLPIMRLLISLDVYSINHPVGRFVMVAGSSVFVSMFTYLIIEKKFNFIGHEFGSRYISGVRNYH